MSLLVSVLATKCQEARNTILVKKTDSFADSWGFWDSNSEYVLLVRIHILLSYGLYRLWDEKMDRSSWSTI